MRLININSVSKNRIKQMILRLLPKYKYVRITNSGLVVLKKNWYSFKVEKLPVTDVCIRELPKQIANIASKRKLGIGHMLIFTQTIAAFVESGPYDTKVNIVDYLWANYNSYCLNIPTIIRKALPVKRVKELPLLFSMSLLSKHYLYKILKDNKARIIPGKTLLKKIKIIYDKFVEDRRPKYHVILSLT